MSLFFFFFFFNEMMKKATIFVFCVPRIIMFKDFFFLSFPFIVSYPYDESIRFSLPFYFCVCACVCICCSMFLIGDTIIHSLSYST